MFCETLSNVFSQPRSNRWLSNVVSSCISCVLLRMNRGCDVLSPLLNPNSYLLMTASILLFILAWIIEASSLWITLSNAMGRWFYGKFVPPLLYMIVSFEVFTPLKRDSLLQQQLFNCLNTTLLDPLSRHLENSDGIPSGPGAFILQHSYCLI